MAFQPRQNRPSYAFRPNKGEGNSKYPEKSGNYSPSARYFYGGASQPPQHQHQGQNQHQGQGQHRRNQHKRDSHGHQNDRVVKQNDVIIRLLKEIRDRLPAPAMTETERAAQSRDHERNEVPQQDTEQQSGEVEQFDGNQQEEDDGQARFALADETVDPEE